MLINDYQFQALATAIYPGKKSVQGLIYTTLKLNGEAGEVAEGVGKAIRDDGAKITPEREIALVRELGDVLWYVAATANELGYDLSEIAQINLDKLKARREAGTLSGSGSDR